MAVDITTWGTGSYAQFGGMQKCYKRARFDILPPVVPGSGLTIEYFQRVYAADAGIGWCYFTKTSIDTNPGKADTTPNGGAAGFVAGSYSVVKILEIY